MKTISLVLMCLMGITCRTFSAFMDDGDAKIAKHDFDAAIVDYTKVIEQNTNDALAYNKRGTAKATRGDLDGAIADFDKAIGLKPDAIAFYCNRGFAKQTKFDFDGAIADFNKAIALKPNDNNIKTWSGLHRTNQQNQNPFYMFAEVWQKNTSMVIWMVPLRIIRKQSKQNLILLMPTSIAVMQRKRKVI